MESSGCEISGRLATQNPGRLVSDVIRQYLALDIHKPPHTIGNVAEIFRHQYRVTYAECTVGNHVYYARYLDLLERARGEFFRHVGKTFADLQAADTIFPVIEVRMKYKAPARYDELLTIELWLTDLGKIRMNFGCRVIDQSGNVLVEGETWHVCTSMNEKPKRAPDNLVEALKPYFAHQI